MDYAKRGFEYTNIIPQYDADLTNTIAMIHAAKGELDKVLEYYLKALSLNPNESGQNNGNVAASLLNIALIFNERGENANAMDFCRKSLEIWLNLYGENHPNVASAYNAFANFY